MFVIVGSSGEYSDYRTWVHSAHTSSEDAAVVLEKLICANEESHHLLLEDEDLDLCSDEGCARLSQCRLDPFLNPEEGTSNRAGEVTYKIIEVPTLSDLRGLAVWRDVLDQA